MASDKLLKVGWPVVRPFHDLTVFVEDRVAVGVELGEVRLGNVIDPAFNIHCGGVGRASGGHDLISQGIHEGYPVIDDHHAVILLEVIGEETQAQASIASSISVTSSK